MLGLHSPFTRPLGSKREVVDVYVDVVVVGAVITGAAMLGAAVVTGTAAIVAALISRRGRGGS